MTSRTEARRIGGEFELAMDDFAGGADPGAPSLTFGAAQEIWVDTGRSALALVARRLREVAPKGIVWLPAYSCESIAEPFLRQALAVRFYAVGAQLDRIDASPGRGDTLLAIHYFGRRNLAALRIIPQWRANGVRVIEDCVQAALTTDVGTRGDHAVTSLRKLLPQPDGALLASREALPATLADASEAFVSARMVGKVLRGAQAPADAYLPLLDKAERTLRADLPRAMSWLSRHLLARADLAHIAARRRANFAQLRQALADQARRGVTPLLDPMHEGEVPLGYPVIVDAGRRDALRHHLATDRIFCPVHWDLSHLPEGGFEQERALSASLLTLPIDQRYGDRDMAAIVDSISNFSRDRS